MDKKQILQSGVIFEKLPKNFQEQLIQQVINIKTDDGQTIYPDTKTVLGNNHFDDRTYTIYRWVYDGVEGKIQIEQEEI